MIGFPVDVQSAEAMSADLSNYARQCEFHQLKEQNHLCVVRDKSGAELWIGTKNHAGAVEIATANPALSGEGKIDVVVDGDVSPKEWKPFEVRVQARLAGGSEVPLVLDLADPREAGRFAPKARLTVDVTAFADEITLHESEAAYYASQTDREVKFASNYFIPSGMFADEADPKNAPTAHALFAGKILKSELRTNDRGKAKYWWFLVETLDGAVLNVVADPKMVKQPKVGGYLDGSFWMSARIKGP